MTFRRGDRVLQPVYGSGDVVDVNENHITISFDAGDVRKFVVRLVQLERTNTPRPPRPEPASRPRKRRAAVPTAVPNA